MVPSDIRAEAIRAGKEAKAKAEMDDSDDEGGPKKPKGPKEKEKTETTPKTETTTKKGYHTTRKYNYGTAK